MEKGHEKNNYSSVSTRLLAIEDALMDLSTQISILKTAFSKINARVSTDMRKTNDVKGSIEDIAKDLLLSRGTELPQELVEKLGLQSVSSIQSSDAAHHKGRTESGK